MMLYYRTLAWKLNFLCVWWTTGTWISTSSMLDLGPENPIVLYKFYFHHKIYFMIFTNKCRSWSLICRWMWAKWDFCGGHLFLFLDEDCHPESTCQDDQDNGDSLFSKTNKVASLEAMIELTSLCLKLETFFLSNTAAKQLICLSSIAGERFKPYKPIVRFQLNLFWFLIYCNFYQIIYILIFLQFLSPGIFWYPQKILH